MLITFPSSIEDDPIVADAKSLNYRMFSLQHLNISIPFRIPCIVFQSSQYPGGGPLITFRDLLELFNRFLGVLYFHGLHGAGPRSL